MTETQTQDRTEAGQQRVALEKLENKIFGQLAGAKMGRRPRGCRSATASRNVPTTGNPCGWVSRWPLCA